MSVALIDTNILVYRFDWRFPDKQRIATDLLRDGIASNSIRLPHQAVLDQAVLEFIPATTRLLQDKSSLLSQEEARREAEELLNQFETLYPNDDVLRTALRGAAAYQLSWFDAHMWAYAECFGLDEIISEDFQHDRMYGSVRVVNPFKAIA
jgi:predicted nucleic acid-binding protein